MKTASLPSLRVAPELRDAAESVLEKGETLSSFLEQSLRAHIHRRKVQQEFVARAMSSGEQARRTGEYVSAEQVLLKMDRLLTSKAKSRK